MRDIGDPKVPRWWIASKRSSWCRRASFFKGFAAKYLNHFDLLVQSRYIFLLVFLYGQKRVVGSDTENQPRGLIFMIFYVEFSLGLFWESLVTSDVILLMEEILHQLIESLSHYLEGFIHPRWLFGISSINRRLSSLFLPRRTCHICSSWTWLATSWPSCHSFMINSKRFTADVGCWMVKPKSKW